MEKRYDFQKYEFLHHEWLNDRLCRVYEDYGGPQSINLYVVVGDEKIAIVDTGLGATGDLRDYIEEKITGRGKPMIALMTHTHCDHVGGCTMFDEQYIHTTEMPQLSWATNDMRRVHDAVAFAFTGVPGSRAHGDLERALAIGEYCEKHYVPIDWKRVRWRILLDGDVIDLGGVKLEVIFLNIHGSLIYYDRERDYALVGDNLTYTFAPHCSMKEIVDSLSGLLDHFGPDTMLYSGHTFREDLVTDPEEISAPIVRELIADVRALDAGHVFEEDQKDVFYSFPGAPTLMGHMPDPEDAEGMLSYQASHLRQTPPPEGKERYIHNVHGIRFGYYR